MTFFEYFLNYLTDICEQKRAVPEGYTVTGGDPEQRAEQLQQQIAQTGMEAFVRACAAADGTVIPEEVFAAAAAGDVTLPAVEEQPDEAPVADEPDPDAGKHAFEVFLDCINQEDGLVLYLAESLKNNDRTAFYKLSQVTTHLDLDPDEFLYWLAHREDYASEEERSCAVLMDSCLERLKREGRMDVVAALLSGDQQTFEVFRCEAPELQHIPAATFAWFCENYLDRDYPVRFLLKHNGVKFPENYGGSHDCK